MVAGVTAILALAKPEYSDYALIPAALSLGVSAYAIAREKYNTTITHQASYLSHNAEYFKPLTGVMVAIGAATASMKLGHINAFSMAPVALGTFLNSLFTISWMARLNIQKISIIDLAHGMKNIHFPSTSFDVVSLPIETIASTITFPATLLASTHQRIFELLDSIDVNGTLHYYNQTPVHLNKEHWKDLAPYCLAIQLGQALKKSPLSIMEDLHGCTVDTLQNEWFTRLQTEYQVTGTFQTKTTLEYQEEGTLHF